MKKAVFVLCFVLMLSLFLLACGGGDGSEPHYIIITVGDSSFSPFSEEVSVVAAVTDEYTQMRSVARVAHNDLRRNPRFCGAWQLTIEEVFYDNDGEERRVSTVFVLCGGDREVKDYLLAIPEFAAAVSPSTGVLEAVTITHAYFHNQYDRVIITNADYFNAVREILPVARDISRDPNEPPCRCIPWILTIEFHYTDGEVITHEYVIHGSDGQSILELLLAIPEFAAVVPE